MALRKKNNRLEPEGGKPERLGGLLRGEKKDEAITVAQLEDYLNGELATSAGGFITIDADRAIKIKTPSGYIYLPILVYP